MSIVQYYYKFIIIMCYTDYVKLYNRTDGLLFKLKAGICAHITACYNQIYILHNFMTDVLFASDPKLFIGFMSFIIILAVNRTFTWPFRRCLLMQCRCL